MKLRISLAVVAATLIMPATALASEGTTRGCPASKDWLSIAVTLQRIDKSIYVNPDDLAALGELIAGVDVNGDGYLCSKQFAPNRGQDKQWGGIDYVITQISDNQPAGRSPS